jgi:membrane protease YdiL (CAAX protease family)
VVVSAMVVLFGLHAVPGFNNPLIVRDVILSTGAEPFSLYLNFDKTAAGLVLLAFFYKGHLSSRQQVREAIRAAAPVIGASILFLIGTSFAVDYLRFAPKLPNIAFIWVMNNLFFVTLSEEAFFRGFLMTRLESVLSPAPKARSVALVLSAAAFGLAHFAGGLAYVCIATVAGIGYGLAFQRSGRIEMAILTHFAVNVTHFFLFTYPRSA